MLMIYMLGDRFEIQIVTIGFIDDIWVNQFK